MFDRYAGNNKEKLKPEQKLYLDGVQVVLPAKNLMSFLSATNTPSAVKRFYEPKVYKSVAQDLLSFVSIEPENIPFVRDGKVVEFHGFDEKTFFVRHDVARLDKGIPNPKERPVLTLPWELTFEITFFTIGNVNESMLKDLFVNGGLAMGIGTYRGVFGKFEVTAWEKI